MCNRDEFSDGLLYGFIAGGIVGSLFFGGLKAREIRSIKRQAIEVRVAEYRVDKKTGVSEFVFIKHGDQSKGEIGTIITPLEK